MTGVPRRRPHRRLLFVFSVIALFALTPASSAFQASVSAHNLAGRKALRAHDWKTAATEYRASLAIDPSQTDVQISYGIALWSTGDRQAAADAFQKAIALEPNSARAHLNVAIAYRDLGQ